MAQAVESLLTLVSAEHLDAFWQHPKWWQLANQYLFNNGLDVILVTDESDELIAALPVHSGKGLLKSPQHPHLTIIDSLWLRTMNPQSVDAVMDAVLKNVSAWGWNSPNVPDRSQVSHCRQVRHWQWRESRRSAWFDTTGDLPLPGKLRRNLARHERHLQEHGDLRYSSSNSLDSDATAEALQNFLDLEAAGWKGQSGTAIKADPMLMNFYLGLQELNTDELMFEVHQLHQATRCIAVKIAVRCGSTRYLLKIAHDEACGAHSPGSLLLWRVLQDCVDTDVDTLSLVSSPDWATRWKPQSFPVWHVTRFAHNPQGALYLHADRLKIRVKEQLKTTRNRIRP